MTLYINNGRDGSPSKLGGDIDASSCRIEFTEATYSLDASGNFGTLTYVNTSTTDSKAIAPNTELKAGDMVQLKFTTADYETEFSGKKSAKKTSPKQQKFNEIFLKAMGEGTAFSGFICLAAELNLLDCLLTGKDAKGVEMPDMVKDMIQGNGYKLESMEVDKLKDVAVGSGGVGKKQYQAAQTELGRLTDSLTFLETFSTANNVALSPEQKLNFIFRSNVSLNF